MSASNDMTPRQWVMDQQIAFLHNMHGYLQRNGTWDSNDLPPARVRDVLIQIAKQHNALLEKSGLDGLALPERTCA